MFSYSGSFFFIYFLMSPRQGAATVSPRRDFEISFLFPRRGAATVSPRREFEIRNFSFNFFEP